MLFVNFKAYNSYVTDSLYQWDINQALNIVGLSLTKAPEVHFANANMERAIVRPSTMNKDTITVTIPNSLLQESLPIKAYIGVYEGETFKVIESIKIPVIPKERPTDYVFVDDGGDIYSYNEILNKMIAFENKYDDINFDVVREYAKLVEDLATRVTPIEEAIANLSVKGSYEGSGEARTIDIGGQGDVLLITTDSLMLFVTRAGAIGRRNGASNLLNIESSVIKFENGVLHLSSNSYNATGTTYNYQVL